MLVHDQHQDFAVSQSYDYCMLTQHFDAKLRSVGEPPPDCPGIFLTGKCKKRFAATQAEMQRPVIPVIHGHPRFQWGSPLLSRQYVDSATKLHSEVPGTWDLEPGWMFFGSPALKIEVPSHWGPQQKSPVGRILMILMVPQLGEAQVI